LSGIERICPGLRWEVIRYKKRARACTPEYLPSPERLRADRRFGTQACHVSRVIRNLNSGSRAQGFVVSLAERTSPTTGVRLKEIKAGTLGRPGPRAGCLGISLAPI
jgi:hypothetical protein